MSDPAEAARAAADAGAVAAAIEIIAAVDGWSEAVDRLPAPAYLTDAAGRIQRANAAFEDLSASRQWSLGVVDREAALESDCALRAALTGEARIVKLVGIAAGADGERLVFAAYPACLMSAEREIIGAVNIFIPAQEGRVALLRALAARYARINRRLLHFPTANALRWMADEMENEALRIVLAPDR